MQKNLLMNFKSGERMNFHFILSRYKETASMEYLSNFINDTIGKDFNCSLFIYDKFEKKNDTYVLLPNIGREAISWVQHIIDTWENPPDYYAFIHPCGPNERSDKFAFLESLLKDIESNSLTRHFGPQISFDDKKSNFWDFNFSHKNKWYGNTKENIEDVRLQPYTATKYKNMGQWWKDISGILEFPKQRSFAGICYSSKGLIQSWGIKFWKNLREQIIEGGPNGEIGHFLERTMYRIAQGKYHHV